MGKRWRNVSNARIRKAGARINHEAACCCCCIADGADLDVTLDSITDESSNNVCVSDGCDSLNATYLVNLVKAGGQYCCLRGDLDVSGSVSTNCDTNTEYIRVAIVRGYDPADSHIIVMQTMYAIAFANHYQMVWKITGTAADTAIQSLCDGNPVTLDWLGYTVGSGLWTTGSLCTDVSATGTVGACVHGGCTIQLA